VGIQVRGVRSPSQEGSDGGGVEDGGYGDGEGVVSGESGHLEDLIGDVVVRVSNASEV